MKFGELNNDDDEPDAQTAARSIGGVAEPQEFGKMKFGELKRNQAEGKGLTQITISLVVKNTQLISSKF